MPDISLVIPFRNEAGFLRQTLNTLLSQDLGPFSAEILLVDGMSQDGSSQIALEFARQSSGSLSIRLLPNPRIKVPYAFNLGIDSAQSNLIGFGGAHTLYPPHYLRRAIELSQTIEADVFGGGHDQILSSSPGLLSDAIGCLYLSSMGAGVAQYHRQKSPAYVDTVYGGFYRPHVFERVGKFNEFLARNQDNEFNARVTDAGFKIYYHPDLDTSYVQKTSFRSFLERALNFGRYHPTTWWINPGSFRIRHAVPLFWVLYLFALPLLAFFIPTLVLWASFPALLYFGLLVVSAGRLIQAGKSSAVGLLTIPLFALYHILYGLGTVQGFALLFHMLILQKKAT